MNMQSLHGLLIRSAIVGVIAALVVLYLVPDNARIGRPVVEMASSIGESSLPLSGTGPYSYAHAVRQASPAVVNVYTTKTVNRKLPLLAFDPTFRRLFEDPDTTSDARVQNSLGSGVIVSPQGYVVTNYHVIEGADEIYVMLGDERSVTARVVGTDLETDLAVLELAARDLPAIVVGNSDGLEVGDVALAIGNPFGVGKTVTQGIISATGRSQVGISAIENFIQTDAAINPGNSGGALINARGELIGINTAIFSNSGGSLGIGFAIPAGLARDVMTQIIENGHVVRGWLGVQAQDVTDQLAESYGFEETQGVLVTEVMRGGPAEAAGLRPSDILTHMNDKELLSSKEAFRRIARHRPGDVVTISGIRRGTPFRQSVTIAERPKIY
ncbi:MAG: trypsin-like peptidase domain-containing protein [Gammaproteobacteria bacterium]|jgi:serine protease DegS|nr:trypsin-like peptidase domain-containing protein [Gammaproteobacteria bacterium]